MRTPEEIHRYGKDVIEKHCNKLPGLNSGLYPEITDENNQIFRISDYRDWKYEVLDFIQEHDPDRFDKIDSLFRSFELLFSPSDLSEIIGILSSSINKLKRKERGVSPDNSQTAQTNNETASSPIEPEPRLIVENPPKEKEKVFTWKRVLYSVLFLVVIAIITVVIIHYFDNDMIAVYAAIIGAIAAIIGLVYKIFFNK